MTDKLFKHSREMLRAKDVDLKEKGLGNRAKRADPFTRIRYRYSSRKNFLDEANLGILSHFMIPI
ncbi:hypothetical protein DPMN_039821 [Dreissena polymorpha]|uniref:Uncharacterized protein n=1 Tax=Dreissena polymorpha TaxID=45954 RepID=A0A9D4CVI3_DREPO|nr:hypothetical protein DPMN_039767 [Dreissena polymorpha]KAH3733394.1 hypothetical protein DPMN_039821 [Dreissena polymorpha]